MIVTADRPRLTSAPKFTNIRKRINKYAFTPILINPKAVITTKNTLRIVPTSGNHPTEAPTSFG